MKILGFIPTSFSDWDGKLVSILFLGGCNYRCPFCQNYPLLQEEDPERVVEWADIARNLSNRKQWIDGIVISGGEPLMHPEVFDLCTRIKELGFAVKLDTNGSFPFALMELVQRRLVDYVAVDIKTALDERYDKACGVKVEAGLVNRTIDFLMNGKLEYEFRTTLVPGLVGKPEITSIAKRIKGARKFALQQFVPDNARIEAYRKKKPYNLQHLQELAAIVRPQVKELVIRGKAAEK
jgi:pyruvate formate lyase activating enzyme